MPEQIKHRSSSSGSHSRSHSSRRHSSRSRRKILKLRITVGVLLVLIVGLSIGWFLTSVKLADMRGKYYKDQASVRKGAGSTQVLEARIADLEAQNASLVVGQIPGLALLEYDKTLQIDREYLRNIGFTLTGTAYSKNYEYRAVLHNNSMNIVRPLVTVYLFDERGIQIGQARLSRENATSRVDSENLQPDETRSYTGRVELNLESEPKYFLVTLDS